MKGKIFMKKLKKVLKKIPKINYVVFLVLVVLFASFMFPSLARFNNRVPTTNITTWDGTVAQNYRKGTGTSDDPYIIANGAELAYFAEMLKTTNYENTYFKLNNDIVLNNGIFGYDEENGPTYKLSNSTFYLKEYSNEFYDNVNRENTKIGTINLFSSLDNFQGHFDGNFYTIYGLYITNDNEDIALFTNLNGEVNNLYIENALIYGGSNTAGVASNVSNSTLTNILFNGHVIGKKLINTVHEELLNEQHIVIDNELVEYKIALPNLNINNITKTTLTGNVNSDIFINGTEVTGDFSLDLGNLLLDEVTVTFKENTPDEVIITNLKYDINYNIANTAGIIADGNNVTLNKVINKANVFGEMFTAGIIAKANDVVLNNTYNIGTIQGQVSAGIIASTNKNISLNYVYNSGLITGTSSAGLITNINNSTVNINNSFDAQDSTFVINIINNSNVTIDNSYAVTQIPLNSPNQTNFIKTTLDNLNNKEFMITNLNFKEFVDQNDIITNDNNIWIYEENSLPILYIDDIKNPIANIHVGTYTWNNLGVNNNLIYFNSNITFNITQADNLKPIQEIYYYISPSEIPLTKTELESINNWTDYQDVIQIDEEGFYIIYAKIIDTNNNIFYINTDTLVLDKSKPIVNIELDTKNWTSYHENLDYIYINDTTEYSIIANDNLSGISSIQYYISNQILDLDSLTNVEWIDYLNKLQLDTLGTYIIYAKVVDNCGFTTYVNSDYIIYNGYSVNSLKVGYSEVDANYISALSSVTFNYTYQDSNPLKENESRNIISNTLLPNNTKITLIDNINKKVYFYQTTDDNYGYDISCSNNECKYATYPLNLFKELGTNSDSYFIDTRSSINDDFTINFDFSEADIVNNYENVVITLAIKNDDIVRDTLISSKKTFNIIDSNQSFLYINSDYDNQPIQYNSNSTTEININTGLNQESFAGNIVHDSSNEGKIIGIAIKLIDSENNIVSKEKLKNIKFKIADKEYSPDDDGIVRINLENGLNSVNKTLTIVTYEDEASLNDGNYSFVINSYLAYDGFYTNNYSADNITIPVKVSNYVKNEYNFDVLFADEYKIIDKKNDVTLDLNILQTGVINGSVRISLYKKSQLTAYNQDYNLINLADYITNELTIAKENVYNLVENPIVYNNSIDSYNNVKLNLKPANLENGGYKLVFELFDGNQKVGVIEKKFIIR